jgi:hypothetical protein
MDSGGGGGAFPDISLSLALLLLHPDRMKAALQSRGTQQILARKAFPPFHPAPTC